MNAKRGTVSAITAGNILGTIIQVAIVSVLIWAGLIGLHHPVGYLTIAAFTGALFALVRSLQGWRRS